MYTRRTLLTATALASVAPQAFARPAPPPPILPDDSDFWREIQGSFTLDRTVVNLNNGGCSPTPRVVHEALLRYLALSNTAPPYAMWELLEPGVESVRRDLAREAGCDPEELAITRNASEALQIAQLGISLVAGDEVVTTDQDYPRMLDTWDQRARREGIVVKQIRFPVPSSSPDEIVAAFAAAFTERTKVVHLCHIVNLTGHILPVRAICDVARSRGIVSIVDGAHAFAHFPFRIDALGADYYGTSLHKWLLAPVGTGFLWMRKERIAGHWALQPTHVSREGDIRKFEEIGTHPAANHDAIAEALVFHQGIGAARKAARLRTLRRRWTVRLTANARVRSLTVDDDARSCGIGTFSVEGLEDPGELTRKLWSASRVFSTPIVHPQFKGVRITPNVYTTFGELDVFCDAVEAWLKG